MKLYIARHGNTFEAHETPRMIGRGEDLALTAKGEDQAAALGRYFVALDVRPALVFCGNLKRTHSTAEIASAVFGGPDPVMDTRLTELDYGTWSNLTNEDIDRRFGPAERLAWERNSVMPDSRNWRPPRSEIDAKLSAFVADAAALDTDVLAVTSNGLLRFFADLVPGLFEQLKGDKALKVGTGYLCCFTVEPARISLDFWNRDPVSYVAG